MAKVIITGVDGSESATKAARTAATLARALGAQLHVLSAYGKFEMDRFSSGEEEFVFTSAKDAERTAMSTASDLKREFPDVHITSAPSDGKPGEALVRAAELMGADLIVVGNKRVQGLGRVLGSVARNVASQAPCDVYVANTHQR